MQISDLEVGHLYNRDAFSEGKPYRKAAITDSEAFTRIDRVVPRAQVDITLKKLVVDGLVLITVNTGERVEGLIVDGITKNQYFYTVLREDI